MTTKRSARKPSSTTTTTTISTISAAPPAPAVPVAFTAAAQRAPDDTQLREAFARALPELLALGDGPLPNVGADPISAVGIVLTKLPAIRVLRPKFEQLPDFDLRVLDELETYALALWHAEIEYATATTPSDSMPALLAKCTEARDALWLAAQPLAARGLLPADALAKLRRGGGGYRDTADDLLALVVMFRDKWSAVAQHTVVTVDELDQAGALGRQIAALAARREVGPAAVNEASRNRQRAFALFARAYDEIRRGVTFLRWHEGDLDDIAPSFYVRGPRATAVPKPAPAATAPAATAPAAAAPAAPTGPFVPDTDAERPVPQDDPFGRN